MQPVETVAVSGVPRRVLGQHLRGLRQRAGLTVKMAARVMEWSEPKLWRIETGQTALRALDVEAMCAAYGAGPALTWALAGLARQTRADGWWCAYGEVIPGEFSIYAALEDAACTLAGYAPWQVSGLLRTEAYARTLITSSGRGGEVDRLLGECMARRVMVTRASAPLEVTIAVDEALVRRPVGGPEVMAGQLRFLADMAAQPNVCLRVVPYRLGMHPGLVTGGFTLLDFPPGSRGAQADTAIVYAGELYLDKPHEVARYRAAHAAILGCSLDQAASQDLLLTVAQELQQ